MEDLKDQQLLLTTIGGVEIDKQKLGSRRRKGSDN